MEHQRQPWHVYTHHPAFAARRGMVGSSEECLRELEENGAAGLKAPPRAWSDGGPRLTWPARWEDVKPGKGDDGGGAPAEASYFLLV